MRRRQIFAQRAQLPQFIPAPEIPAIEQVIKPQPEVNPNACPKCGKIVRKGMFIHQKYCKGDV